MKIRKFKIENSAFTLVELLIVIALIGILATALVATLNPVEQINRARDSRYKNDAAELLAAIERYYASTQDYPWVSLEMLSATGVCETDGGVAEDCTNESAFGATADDNGVGVEDGSGNDSSLVTSGELKSSFGGKSQFSDSAKAIDKLYVRKEYGNSSVYSCFIPKSTNNRESAVITDICATGTTSDCGDFQDPVDTCTTSDWSSAGTACFICVPEVGSVSVGST